MSIEESNIEIPTAKSVFRISNAIYDKVKFLCMVLIPAASTLYFTLGSIWDFKSVEEVVGSLAAVNVFLGIVLGISTRSYNGSDAKYDGVIAIGSNENGDKLYSLELNGDPNDLDGKKSVTFRIGE